MTNLSILLKKSGARVDEQGGKLQYQLLSTGDNSREIRARAKVRQEKYE